MPDAVRTFRTGADGIQEVSGSIPLISTTENRTVNRLVCGVFLCFLGKFQTFYAKLIFAQNRQNGHLSTKFVNKLRFWQQKGMEKPPSDCRTAFPLQKEKLTLCRLHYMKIF